MHIKNGKSLSGLKHLTVKYIGDLKFINFDQWDPLKCLDTSVNIWVFLGEIGSKKRSIIGNFQGNYVRVKLSSIAVTVMSSLSYYKMES